jgi:hypothetical protein
MKSIFPQKSLTKSYIRKAQNIWGKELVEIGAAFKNGQDYKSLAEKFVDRHYGYNEGIVLFKPTLATVEQFRDTTEKAVSYFISGNEKYPEDKGFALQPWKNVIFKNSGIILIKKHAVAMGNYYFTDFDDHEVRVEYTFGYFQNESNQIKIHLHHSSMPFVIK